MDNDIGPVDTISTIDTTTPSKQNHTSDRSGGVYRDSRGRWRTQSLFLETSYGSTSKEPPLYTMKPDDHHSGLPSFRRLYMEIGDPTEYKQAAQLVGGWDHWQELLGSKWFNDYVLSLRQELSVKLRSDGILAIVKMLNNGRSMQAAQFFANGEFREKRQVGRPSNEEIAAAATEAAEVKARVLKDAARLGISVAIDNTKEGHGG